MRDMHLVLLLVVSTLLCGCTKASHPCYALCYRVGTGICFYSRCICNHQWEGYNCQTRKCNLPCVNGNCQNDANYCSCNQGWVGKLCDLKPQIESWCSTISNNKVENTIPNSFPDEIAINCNGYLKISKTQILNLGSKIEKDSAADSSERSAILHSLWRGSPELKKYCCYKDSNDYFTYVKTMITFEGNFHDVAQSFVTSEFRKVIDEECPTMPKNDQFCSIVPALPIAEQVASLGKSKSSWTPEDEQAADIILLYAMVLMKEKPSLYGSLQETITVQKEGEIFTNVLNRILKYIQEGEVTALKELHKKIASNARIHSDRFKM